MKPKVSRVAYQHNEDEQPHNVYYIHHHISIVQISYTMLNTVAMFLVCIIIYNITIDYVLLIELHEYK